MREKGIFEGRKGRSTAPILDSHGRKDICQFCCLWRFWQISRLVTVDEEKLGRCDEGRLHLYRWRGGIVGEKQKYLYNYISFDNTINNYISIDIKKLRRARLLLDREVSLKGGAGCGGERTSVHTALCTYCTLYILHFVHTACTLIVASGGGERTSDTVLLLFYTLHFVHTTAFTSRVASCKENQNLLISLFQSSISARTVLGCC